MPNLVISAKPRVHKGGPSIVPGFHPVQNAGSQGDDIFQGASQLHPQHIVVEVNPQVFLHQVLLHKQRRIMIPEKPPPPW